MTVLKTIEIMADSEKGWKDATQKAVEQASKTVKQIKSVWIQDHSATVENGKIAKYRVHTRITFEIEN